MLQLVYELRKSQYYQVYALSFRNVMACAAHYGRVEILTWMVSMAALEPEWWVREKDVMMHALRGGGRKDICLLSLLRDRFSRTSTEISRFAIQEAVKENDLALVQWLYDHEYDLNGKDEAPGSFAMDHARSLAMLELLHSLDGVRCSTTATQTAAECGDLAVIQFLCANRSEGFTESAMKVAAERDHLNVLAFLHERSPEETRSPLSLTYAAKNDHLDHRQVPI